MIFTTSLLKYLADLPIFIEQEGNDQQEPL